MTGGKTIFQRGLAFSLFVVLCAASILGAASMQSSALVESRYNSKSLVRTSLDEIENVLTSTTYDEYRQINAGAQKANDVIEIDFLKDIDPETTTATFNILTSGASKEELARFDMPEKGSENTKSREFFMPEEPKDIVFVGVDGMLSFRVNVKEAGYYNIWVSYFTGNVPVYAVKRDADGKIVLKNGIPEADYGTVSGVGNFSAIERYVLIDGKVPYREARSIELNRIWCDYFENKSYFSDSEDYMKFAIDHAKDTDTERPFRRDGNGNELKPEKRLFSTWTSEFLSDSTGYFTEPLEFYLSAGEHIVSLQAVRETVAMDGMRLCNASAVETPDYDTYYASHGGDAAVYHGDAEIYIQAEYAKTTSERTIYQLNNRSSVYTQPSDPALIRLNEIGGDKWEYVGQWIEWECDILENGFYSIIPRWMQAYYSGMYVSRRIFIDGVLPFKEAGTLRFDYTTDWKTTPLTDGSRDFLFYFEKGRHTIRMEAVLGDMSTVLNRVNNSLSNINAYYRKILMITGSDPDEYRDYNFVRLIPDVLSGLKTEAANLYEVSDLLTKMTGRKGSHSATLDRVANVCERMGKYPTTIAGYMATLKSYSSSLGSWLADTQNQPLEIDYFCIQSKDKAAPKAEPGFFANLWGGIQKFWMSFFSDYDSLGSKEDGTQVSDPKYGVEVWTVTSRDQAQIVRNLVDDSFSPQYGIPITVKLVAGGTLLPATLAGTGPDVYMGAGAGDAVNYALRSAVLSLNTTTGNTNVGYNFNDFSKWENDPLYGPLIRENKIPKFDDVKTRFATTAMRPMTLYGETYGLPETMSFSMLFYRKDIFAELGLSVPDTWEEFYNIIYTLQAEELELGYPTGIAGSTILMYQQGETYYDEGDYDYYLNLFRTYYNEKGYDKSFSNVDDYLKSIRYTYQDADGNVIPTTDGITINLDSDVSLAAFKKVCELFTMYSFPVTYNFANRFRSGEMPITVIDYTSYNTLIVFAPEINGLWEFTPLPGTVSEDPQTGMTVINNTTVGGVSCSLLMRSVTEDNALGAWTYMQWWMSADVQTAYGNEMIALLGPSAKQATANMEALSGMSWSKDEYDNLFAQFNAVECTPQYPGSYIVDRYTNFAFLDVYNKDANPVTKMQSYIDDINNELTRKRAEFNYPTSDTIRSMERELESLGYDLNTFEKKEGGN